MHLALRGRDEKCQFIFFNMITNYEYASGFHQTLNPYRLGLGLIYRRLQWDLSYVGTISKRRISKVRHVQKGGKAVIVCNGPSLLKSDLSHLEGIYTFGLNKINLLFDRSDFRPNCVVSVNEFVLQQNKDFYNSTQIPLYLAGRARKHIKLRNNIAFLQTTWPFYFSRDCSLGVYEGATVTYVAMQLAYHMGFDKVALIGADHNFKEKGSSNQTIESGSVDHNHFDPRYFSGGVKWQLPDTYGMECAYALAREIYESQGRSIYNATVGGELEIFPRIGLEDFIRL